jgi:hypothetical protein
MIQANLQLLRTSGCITEKEGKPISKKFDTVREMSDWVSTQNEHPFLGYVILSYAEQIEMPNGNIVGIDHTWDNWVPVE